LRFLVQNRAETWPALEELVTRGVKKVTLVDMMPKLGKDIGFTTRWTVLQDLRRYGVETVVNAIADKITPQGVVVVVEGEERFIEGDAVVLAAGVSAENALYEKLKDHIAELYLIGDARSRAKPTTPSTKVSKWEWRFR